MALDYLLRMPEGKLRGLHDRLDPREGKVKDSYASSSSDSQD